MKGRIVILDGINKAVYSYRHIKFFPDFSYQRLLWSFTRLDLSAWEFPFAFKLAIASLGSKNSCFGFRKVTNDCRHYSHCFHKAIPL